MIEWMSTESKKLVSYLQIYDTGQQEAWLHWLLLKEFGHHPLSKVIWQDTCIFEQQRVWMHGVDMIFMSFIIFSSHGLYDGSMGRQKNPLLLCLFLGEQEQIFSRTFHGVAGGGDGIISFTLNYQEELPLLEEILMSRRIMGDIFHKEHVKKWSYELARAYLQWPTTLSLGSSGSLMECPRITSHLMKLMEKEGVRVMKQWMETYITLI